MSHRQVYVFLNSREGLKASWQVDQRVYIPYCTLAGFIAVWAISGLLVIVDLVSGTPPGTFFAVIGISTIRQLRST